MEDFTPISGLIGGLMLGSTTVLLLWLSGRLAGISGIVGGIANPKSGETGWRVLFVVGILLGTFNRSRARNTSQRTPATPPVSSEVRT